MTIKLLIMSVVSYFFNIVVFEFEALLTVYAYVMLIVLLLIVESTETLLVHHFAYYYTFVLFFA